MFLIIALFCFLNSDVHSCGLPFRVSLCLGLLEFPWVRPTKIKRFTGGLSLAQSDSDTNFKLPFPHYLQYYIPNSPPNRGGLFIFLPETRFLRSQVRFLKSKAVPASVLIHKYQVSKTCTVQLQQLLRPNCRLDCPLPKLNVLTRGRKEQKLVSSSSGATTPSPREVPFSNSLSEESTKKPPPFKAPAPSSAFRPPTIKLNMQLLRLITPTIVLACSA
ncbi:hypothetical protein PR003_g32580, partial [Phytophthora rubi]